FTLYAYLANADSKSMALPVSGVRAARRCRQQPFFVTGKSFRERFAGAGLAQQALYWRVVKTI
ncbi:hypothetical protein ACW7CD_09120, partial [Klebsiella pneumoniae]